MSDVSKRSFQCVLIQRFDKQQPIVIRRSLQSLEQIWNGVAPDALLITGAKVGLVELQNKMKKYIFFLIQGAVGEVTTTSATLKCKFFGDRLFWKSCFPQFQLLLHILHGWHQAVHCKCALSQQTPLTSHGWEAPKKYKALVFYTTLFLHTLKLCLNSFFTL